MERDLAKITGKTAEDINKLLMHSAEMDYTGAKELYNHRSIPFFPMTENLAMYQIAKGISLETVGSFLNLSNTTGNLFSSDYKAIVDEAVRATASGLSSYSEEMYSALKDLPVGLKVQYDSGYRRRLDSAIRMNIIDGTRSINQRMQEEIGRELGCDGVEISAHALCASDHLPYQGKQYSNKFFENIQSSLKRPFGKWNCRHFWNSIILGVSEPVYSDKELQEYKQNSTEKISIDGKEYTQYEVSQMQRKLETNIREQKEKQILAKSSGNEQLISHSQRKITQYTTKYRQISAKAGFTDQLQGRARVQGYRRTKEKALTNALGNPIIKVKKNNLYSTPNSITQKMGAKGGAERNYYDETGRQSKQIANHNHDNPKRHPLGKHGEHAHDYIFNNEGKLVDRPMRELTKDERKENSDIL